MQPGPIANENNSQNLQSNDFRFHHIEYLAPSSLSLYMKWLKPKHVRVTGYVSESQSSYLQHATKK